ncbi:DMT family transporter [Marinobacter sp. X15-166B]|uniref:DMT family transporter n=1 Tax=Marinobacter sp. X15-166B TaxID=1897620 RepID=UPI00085BE957|nr:DMT family transporter [Marinobacter sp. X15-166B]OEY67771.1 permease [Marinobacter sp. X15-166B]
MTAARKSDLLMIAVTLMAAIGWMFSKEAVLLMPPLLFMAARFLAAGLLLALIAHRQLLALTREQLRRGVTVGAVFSVGMSLWVMGLFHNESLGEGAFLTSLGVVFVPIIARCFFAEPQPTSTWVALPIAISGLALLSLENGFRPDPGQLFFIGSALTFALYFILNTRAANQRDLVLPSGQTVQTAKIPALPLTALALLSVGLITLLESVLLEDWRPVFIDLNPMLPVWILASAVVATAGRFLLQTYAQSLAANSNGVVILTLEPVWVALFAAVWFFEAMTTLQVIGCGLIFAALMVNRWAIFRNFVKRLIKTHKAEKVVD